MIRIQTEGNFDKTIKYLENSDSTSLYPILEKYAAIGVDYLSDETPVDTGLTSESWNYEIDALEPGAYALHWYNDNEVDGVNVALLLQYGHGTRQGGYVPGIDYINPAMDRVFNELSEELWGEVTDE